MSLMRPGNERDKERLGIHVISVRSLIPLSFGRGLFSRPNLMSFWPNLSRARRGGGGLAFGPDGRGGEEFAAEGPLPALPFSVEGGGAGEASPLFTSFARGAKGGERLSEDSEATKRFLSGWTSSCAV